MVTLQERLRYRSTAELTEWQQADGAIMREAAAALDVKDGEIARLRCEVSAYRKDIAAFRAFLNANADIEAEWEDQRP